uniref:HTH_Tnp_Tc3_1 domain-containing protein n=1 Tax=Caenorhabditis japonica TaxID=281687 RepID=A0A8R1IGD9_CAEJA
MGRAPLHTVAEQAQISVMHQLGSSLHMISRYVLSNNRSTSCDCNNEKSYEEKIPVGASRKSVLAQQQCGVELGP